MPGTSITFTTNTVSRAEINHVNMTRDNTQSARDVRETVVTSLFCHHQMFIIRKFINLAYCVFNIYHSSFYDQTSYKNF